MLPLRQAQSYSSTGTPIVNSSCFVSIQTQAQVSSSKAIYTAYGYNCFKVAADDHELRMLASNFTSVVKKVYGTPFISGPACSTLYAVTGGSIDYTYDVSYVHFCFHPLFLPLI